jgi:hypothetical protein
MRCHLSFYSNLLYRFGLPHVNLCTGNWIREPLHRCLELYYHNSKFNSWDISGPAVLYNHHNSRNHNKACHHNCRLGYFTSVAHQNIFESSVADPGSGIRCLFDPWIGDPGSVIGFFRIPISDPGSQTLIFEGLVTIVWVKTSIILGKLCQIFSFSISKIK